MNKKTKNEIVLLSLIILAIAIVWAREFLSPRENLTVATNPPKINSKWYEPLKKENINCEELKEKILDEIDAENHCMKDSDCILADSFGCPFGCYSLINKETNLKNVASKVVEYNNNCEKCIYDCIVPKPQDIKCQDKKCVDISLEK